MTDIGSIITTGIAIPKVYGGHIGPALIKSQKAGETTDILPEYPAALGMVFHITSQDIKQDVLATD
jgi:hypothetical protein